MRQLKLFLLILSALLFVASGVGAAEWEPREDMPSIVEIISANPDFDTLEAAIKAAGIADDFAGPGPYTIFAPTDEAFARLPAGTLDKLLSDKQGLTNLLLCHIVNGDIGPEIAPSLPDARMLNGDLVHFKLFKNDVYLNDEAKIVDSDLIGMNGRVNGIDHVLVPLSLQDLLLAPEVKEMEWTDSMGTIMELIAGDSRFDTLETAIARAGLTSTFTGPGTKTFFAPTDEAFARLSPETLDKLLKSKADLTRVLLYHLVTKDITKEEAWTIRETKSAEGDMIFVKVFKNNLYLDDVAMITDSDLLATNGRVHVIDRVLSPSGMVLEEVGPTGLVVDEETDYEEMTIAEVVAADSRLSTLAAALKAADLTGTLSGAGPYTLFAPTNDAFARLPAGTLKSLMADPQGDLKDLLLYHVIDRLLGCQEACSIRDEMTMNGEDVNIKVFENKIYLNDDALITIKDIAVKNGIIHVIDTVLLAGINAAKHTWELIPL